MTIYIDSDCKCYTAPTEDRTAIDTDYFDGKCKAFIEGYRFVPAGSEWKRSDGIVFRGEMIAPWKNYSVLAAAQAQYEETLEEMQDMQGALNTLGVEADG